MAVFQPRLVKDRGWGAQGPPVNTSLVQFRGHVQRWYKYRYEGSAAQLLEQEEAVYYSMGGMRIDTRTINFKRLNENVCLRGCWTLNQTYLLNASSTLCCFTMAIEVVCTLLYSIFFQRVTSFLLQRFQFCDHWRCQKVPLWSQFSNWCFQSPGVARDAT